MSIKGLFKDIGCGGHGKTNPITQQSQHGEIGQLDPTLGKDTRFNGTRNFGGEFGSGR